MKKIALINLGNLPEDVICEPLQLGFLASYLKQRGISVKIIDEPAGDDVKAELARYAPDYVGVSAVTPLANSAFRMLTYCREQGYRTIIGGTHVSTMPEEAQQYADYVIVGDGEIALHTILTEEPPHGIIKGREVENIDDLPFMDRSMMDMEFYFSAKLKYPVHCFYFLPRKARMASMITSRGCPFGCIYCHNSWREFPVRYNSAEYVVNEIADIKNKYDIDALHFYDDEFFINRKRMLEICARLERAKLNLIWSCNSRVSSVDKETLDAAYSAGCRQVNFGVESGSQKVMDAINKEATVKQAEEAIRLAKSAGLLVYNGFMIGTPGETLDDIRKTKHFILSNAKFIDAFAITIAAPFPGTKLWYYAREHNLIPESFNWDNFRFVTDGKLSVNEFFDHAQLAKIRFGILIAAFFKFNMKFSLYYLRYPAFIMSKVVEVLTSMLGLKRKK